MFRATLRVILSPCGPAEQRTRGIAKSAEISHNTGKAAAARRKLMNPVTDTMPHEFHNRRHPRPDRSSIAAATRPSRSTSAWPTARSAGRPCPAGPAPASTRPGNCATATRRSTSARGCLQAVDNVNEQAGRRAVRHGRARSGRRRPAHDRAGRHARTRRTSAPMPSWASRWPSPTRRPTTAGCRCIRYLGGVGARLLPAPMMNILNGGAHADNAVDVQEFMVMPLGFERFSDAIRCGGEVFHNLKKVLQEKKLHDRRRRRGRLRPRSEEQRRGPGRDRRGRRARPATSWASRSSSPWTWPPPSSTTTRQKTLLGRRQANSTPPRWSICWPSWVEKYPICSIEDGCAEDDWDGWKLLTERLGEQDPAGRRRPVRHQHQAAAARHRRGRRQQHPHQGQPDRHAHRDDRGHRAGPAQRLHRASPATAAARPRTRRSPTWPWRWAPARSRPARPRAPTAWPSTTNCCGSKSRWARRPSTEANCSGVASDSIGCQEPLTSSIAQLVVLAVKGF